MKRSFTSLLILLFALNLNAQIQADFVASSTEACYQLQVTFSDRSTASAGSITSWKWDFGDGSSSTLENPGKLYTRPGIYTVCLIVTGGGDTDTICKEQYITVHSAPEPDFVPDVTIGCTPLTVEFDDLSSSPNGEITTWIWGLGGTNDVFVQTDPEEIVQTTYTTYDKFSVSLTVIDEKGCEATIAKNDIIETYEKINLDVQTSNATGCSLPLDVTFSNESDNIPNVVYTWDFGNGEIHEGFTPPSSVRYNDAGSYDVQLSAYNELTGCTDTLRLENAVLVGGGNINFRVNQSDGCLPVEVILNPGAVSNDVTVEWDFGDGTTSNELAPTHIYNEEGEYEITFTMEVDGCVYASEDPKVIEVHDFPEYELVVESDESCKLPINYNFTIESEEELDVEWLLDGRRFNQPSISYDFDKEKDYTVSVSIESEHGCTTTALFDSVHIEDFGINLLDGIYGCYEVDGTLDAEVFGDDEVANWYWEIDGPGYNETFDIENPTFNITDTGLYDVTVIAESVSGCLDTVFAPGYIGVGIEQEVSFVADVFEGCVSLGHFFTSNTEIPSTSFLWYFDDGSYSTEEHPIHEFGDINIFTITFTAFHNGCPSTDSIVDYIETFGPIAGYKYVQDCADPYYVEFYEQGVDFDSIIWNFGDGTPPLGGVLNPTHTYSEPGEYTVFQTLFNSVSGCNHTQTKVVTILEQPVADFEIAPIVCDNEDLIIYDNSENVWRCEYYLDNEVRAYVGKRRDTLYLVDYDLSQYESITMYAYQPDWECADTLTRYFETIEANITVDFAVEDNPICAGDSVLVTSQASSDAGEIVSYEWYLNDVYAGNQPTTYITAQDRGFVTVQLIVEDENGCRKSETKVDYVEVVAPIADFSSDQKGCLETEVKFVNLSEGISLSYVWDFGDGSGSDVRSPNNTYDVEGIYDVRLHVTDIFGCTDEILIEEAVEIYDPVADFEVLDPFGLCPPHIAGFDNLSLHSTSYEWDFGDGFGRSGQIDPKHVFTEPGVYDVMLIAERSAACKDTLLIEEAVIVRGPEGEVRFEIDSSCAPLTVTFDAESNEPYYYTWDYGNGVLDTFPDRFLEHTTTYTYTEPGEYYPRLIMVDDNNCTRAFDVDDPIVVDDLEVNFEINEGTVCDLPADISVTNLTTASRSNVTYEWYFEGINDVFTDESPSVTYNEPGVYEVKLIAQNGFCIQELVEEAVFIYERPEPLIDISDVNPCEDEDVLLTDLTPNTAGDIVEWRWYVDGQLISQDSTFSYPFPDNGAFTVGLEVITEFGCENTISEAIEVRTSLDASAVATVDRCGGGLASLAADIPLLNEAESYSWMVNDSLICDNCLDVQLPYREGDTYFFSVTNEFGCERIVPATIVDIPFDGPEFDLAEEVSICANLDAVVSISGGQPSYEVEWYDPNGALPCNGDCESVTVNTDEVTWVGVRVTDEYGCFVHDTIAIDLIQDAFPFAGPDATICEDLEVNLSADAGARDIIWEGEGIECNNCDEISFVAEEDVRIYLTALSDNDCIIRDTIDVFVTDRVKLDAGQDTTICEDSEAIIRASGPGAFAWLDDPLIEDNSMPRQVVSPMEPTYFVVDGIDDNCVAPDTVLVNIKPNAQIELKGDTVCYGAPAIIKVKGRYDDMSWLSDDLIFEEMDPGSFLVDVTESTEVGVEGYLEECLPDQDFADILVHEMPDMDLDEYHEIYPGQEVFVDLDIPSSLYDVFWGPNESDHPCPECISYSVITDEDVTYKALIVDKATGCVDSSLLQIVVKRVCGTDLYYVPNAFSPNEDGNNDIIKVEKSPFAPDIISFRIYDRWGNRVFESRDIDHGWDGRHDGQMMKPAVFVYVLEVPCIDDGSKAVIKGDITLIR